MGRVWLISLCSFLISASTSVAQFGGGPEDAPSDYGGWPKRRADSDAAYTKNLAMHADNPNVLILPGLIADKEARRVEVLAETTELGPGGIIEFLLIDQTSGRGYESLLWSFARPSDVHSALEFIGMKAGKPFHPEAFRFWAKGERVIVSLRNEVKEGVKNAAGERDTVRLETLILDKRTDRQLEQSGFVFTGSYRISPEAPVHGGAYAPDVFEPKSIGSIFNTRLTVLDVPMRSLQRDVYGKLVLHPDAGLKPHELVTLILEPEKKKDESNRVADLKMSLRKDKEQPVQLTDVTSGKVLGTGDVAYSLAQFEHLAEEGKDIFVQLDFANDLSVQEVRGYANLIKTIDKEVGIRIEPPLEGQLYYEAFCPRPGMLDRKERFVHPWELQLKVVDGALAGTLWLYRFDEEDEEEHLVAVKWEIPSSDVLAREIERENQRREQTNAFTVPPILFVYVPPEMTYGSVTKFIETAFPEKGTIYAFLQSIKHPPHRKSKADTNVILRALPE